MAFNGSPRKKWNTGVLLENVVEGARAAGAEAELVHLYDLDFKGCASCFACKRKGVVLEQCATRDDLLPVLKKVRECDAVVLGAPVYFGCVSGEMRSFMERLLFPYRSYDKGSRSLFGRKIRSAFVYTMNIGEAEIDAYGYRSFLGTNERYLRDVFGSAETLLVTETRQFSDYGKYAASKFDGGARTRRNEEVFPEDCRRAFELGRRLVACGEE